MPSLSLTRLQQVIDRFEEVEARMGATSDSKEIITLSKEHAELRPVVEKARELMAARRGLEEALALAGSGDAEMAALAQMEVEDLKERLPALEQDMQILLLPKDVDDKANVVLEVRAGTGGAAGRPGNPYPRKPSAIGRAGDGLFASVPASHAE